MVTLANNEVSLSVSTRGARITNLVNLADDREWLAQPRYSRTSPAAYGSLFTETDHFGWDEMFPSVDACSYPIDPFEGVEVVDHGELWSKAWEISDETAISVRHRVSSERFFYTFERSLELSGATLRAQYECVVNGDVSLPMLWALHPQFSMLDGSRLLLAGEHAQLVDTSNAEDPRRVEWVNDLIVERDIEPGADRMLYVSPDERPNSALLIDSSGSWLRLRWDNSFARYLGIWMDNGRFTSGRVIAVEPTNGYFDEVARAHRGGTVSVFEPGERVTWWVEATLGNGEVPWKNM